LGILFGVLAATFWGVGDFLITLLTRRVGTRWALLSIQALSLAAWGLIVLAHAPPATEAATPALWGILLATAVCHVAGLAFVYRAFEVGNLAIVSPISSSFAIVTAALSLLSGERPPALVLAGTALLIVGVTLATRAPASGPSAHTLRGVPEAILSAVSFGTMFWLFYFFVQPRMGYGIPMVSLKVMAVLGSALAFLRRPAESPAATGSTSSGSLGLLALLAAGAAIADTLAWLTYIGGTHTSYATVVTALASLFSAVTVILAWRFFRERLAPHQWVGIAVILIGILIVSV
jgi:drug/metabolite transporter (DMT)-like permease